MRKFTIVAWYTFSKQVKSWSFAIMVILPLILLAVTFGTEYVIYNSMGDTYAVVSNKPEISKPFAKKNVKDYVDDSIDTVSSAKENLRNGSIDGYVDIEVKQGRIQVDYFGSKKIDSNFKKKLVKYLKHLQGQYAKIDYKQNSQISHFNQTLVIKEHLKKLSSNPLDNPFFSVSTIFAIMFLIITTYSSITAQEIAADKGTKAVEVIFSSISDLKYFTAKVTGILGLVIIQLVIYVVIGGTGLGIIRYLPQANVFRTKMNLLTYIETILQSLSGTIILYILLGIVLFIILAAYCGAVVKRTEDATKAAQPVTYLLLFIFFIALAFSGEVRNPFMVFLSFIPGFSSFIMPLRLVMKTANIWENILALIILLICIALCVISVGKSYKKLMLQDDSKPFWKN